MKAQPNVASVTLAWNASAGSGVVGYYLYEGSASRNYTNRIAAGNVTAATVSGLDPGTTYYFAVTAYDNNGLESEPSSEVTYTPSASSGTYYGTSLGDPTQAAADSDGDTLSTLVEYAVGTDPLDSTDAQAGIRIFITQTGSASYLTMQYKSRVNAAMLQLNYVPEVSADNGTWFSDGSHVQIMSVAPLDTEFNWVTVQDTTPLSPKASRFMRLRVALEGTLQSTTPAWIGTDTLLRGNNLTLFSQRMVRPVRCAGTVDSVNLTGFSDTSAQFAAGQFGTNGTPAYVELEDGAMINISQTDTNRVNLAANGAQAPSAGESYRIRAQFTVASLFGTNNETGLTAGPSPAEADNVLLYDAKRQNTLIVFYYSNPTQTAWSGWVRADTLKADGEEVIEPNEGVMVRRIVANDAHLYMCGPIKAGLAGVQVQPGFNLLGTLNSSSSLALSSLNLYTGDSSSGLLAGINPSASDNLIVVSPDGSLGTFFYYSQPGLFEGWLNAKGYAAADNVLIPAGSAFFINRQAPTGFSWALPVQP